ncbi:MAG: Gfo/Idh/MocA family oxidoreductase [Candidatus Omnitrophica bacterium]|nr:Gfo/Idh/MocA family oxidoreductase [Candidatus Omnitrophota bacterium]
MVNMGVIGCGHWGPNHIRIFNQLPNSNSLMCADLDENRLKAIQQLYPNIQAVKDYQEILNNPQIDGVCIAAPTKSHYEIAKAALLKNKHVLCEKPLAVTVAECEDLKKIAEQQKRVLLVGHVFVFNATIAWVKDYIDSGDMGNIFYAYATRVNLGPFRYDVNALWDLAPHDISIFNYFFNNCPVNVSARGHKVLGGRLEDLSFATLEYPNNIVANLHVSWLDPRKVRQITIVGDKKMLVWDDLDSECPVKIYDKHVEKTDTFYETYGEFQLLSKVGSIMIPKINLNEPLKAQAQYFIECMSKDNPPSKADAQKAADVVKTLIAIQKSMDAKGECVNL